MIGYKENKTQEQRILDLLKERGPKGVFVWEFMLPRPQGLGIAQYNARIWGLRKKGHLINNKTPGHFILITTDWEKMRIDTINERNKIEEKPDLQDRLL